VLVIMVALEELEQHILDSSGVQRSSVSNFESMIEFLSRPFTILLSGISSIYGYYIA
jgi:hypothetical protein